MRNRADFSMVAHTLTSIWEDVRMDQEAAIRVLAGSVTALARIVRSELSRIGIETNTRNVLEAIEGQAYSVYTLLGGTIVPDLLQGGEKSD
jgi:hypothetical protein